MNDNRRIKRNGVSALNETNTDQNQKAKTSKLAIASIVYLSFYILAKIVDFLPRRLSVRSSRSDWDNKRGQAELGRQNSVTVNIDYKQMGVGGDNSWGAEIHPEYMFPAQYYSYGHTISPISAAVSTPVPANGQLGVDPNAILQWTSNLPGNNEYEVFFGPDSGDKGSFCLKGI
jgi:hypothetical protein